MIDFSPGEIQFSHVAPIVHVAKVVNVGGGADAVDDTLLVLLQVDGLADQGHGSGVGQPQKPVNVKCAKEAGSKGQTYRTRHWNRYRFAHFAYVINVT